MDVIVAGGGLAGLAASVALAQHGFAVELFEAKPFVGGRATSYVLGPGEPEIDNCQHVLLKCCVNLLDFYRRVGVAEQIEFHREFYFLEPGGRKSLWRRGLLPAPAHFTEALLGAQWLSFGEKAALGRAMLAVLVERKRRRDLEEISMAEWLAEKRQPRRVIERFWRQVLVSAINVELEEMAAAWGFQVLWLAFLARPDTYEMGLARVPLAQLYANLPAGVKLEARRAVRRLDPAQLQVETDGGRSTASAVISALPSEKLRAVAPGLEIDFPAFEASSIMGVHIWFAEPVTELPHGTLLDRQIQWFFAKDGGRYLQLVVSASDPLLRTPRQEILDLSLRELAEFLPRVAQVPVVRAHVVKEARATFRARPGLETKRPLAKTAFPGFFLAGDWTRSGWPSTMEGAVRSGYLAAEAAAEYLGRPGKFLLPDVA